MQVSGELRQRHKVTVDFAGPSAGETATTTVAAPSAGVGSVPMELVGIGAHIESVAPYVLFGDANGDFAAGEKLDPAEYTMAPAAYAGKNASGDVLGSDTIRFSIADEPQPNPRPVLEVSVEGELFLDDLDFAAELGPRLGGVFKWRGAITDGTIDVKSEGVENPLINAVEIFRLGGDQAPAPAPETPAPMPKVSVHGATGGEGDGIISITFDTDRAVPLTEEVTVNFEIVGVSAAPIEDYACGLNYSGGVYSGSMGIVGGSAVGSIEIDILQDALAEGAESFVITITSISGAGATIGDGTAEVTIVDDDVDGGTNGSGDGDGGNASQVIHRWNGGKKTVTATDGGPDWQADKSALDGSAKLKSSPGVIAKIDSSVPETTPNTIFADEYWGSSAKTEMGLDFGDGTLEDGHYAVRLYMGNAWSGTSDPGERVFDVSVEGELFLDDLDLAAELGHKIGGMFEWRGTVDDGTINIDFAHVVENPLINAVEILRLDADDLLM